MLFFPTPLTPFFALTLVVGIPACIYLKKWGTIAAFFVFTVLIFFQIESFTKAPIWHLGMVLSILLTLYIAEIGSGEYEVLFETLNSSLPKAQNQSEPYKVEFEKLKSKHQHEMNQLQERLAILSRDVEIEQEKNRGIQSLLERAEADFNEAKQRADLAKHEALMLKEELESKKIKDEHVLQELLDQRKEIFHLREQLQEVQAEGIQNNTPNFLAGESEIQDLRDLLNKKEQDLFNLQFRLDSALEDIQEREKSLSAYRTKEESYQEMELESNDKITILQNEKELLQFTIHQLQREVEQMQSLKQEKEILESTLKSFEDEVQQLRLMKETEQLEMNHQMETLIQEKESLQLIVQKLKQEAEGIPSLIKEKEKLENSLKSAEDKFENLLKSKEEMVHQVEAWTLEKKSLQSIIQKLQAESEQIHVLEQEKANLESALISMEKEVENAFSTQETQQIEMNTRLNAFVKEKESLQSLITKLQQELEQAQSLKHEKEKLEGSLKLLEEQLEKGRLSQAEAHPVVDQNWPKENGLRRRAEAMYLQLKEQFNQKSAVLDETRRQLFLAQEELYKFQKNWKEFDELIPHPQVESLTRHILKMQKGFDQKEKAYLSEIKDLHDIITCVSSH